MTIWSQVQNLHDLAKPRSTQVITQRQITIGIVAFRSGDDALALGVDGAEQICPALFLEKGKEKKIDIFVGLRFCFYLISSHFFFFFPSFYCLPSYTGNGLMEYKKKQALFSCCTARDSFTKFDFVIRRLFSEIRCFIN